MSQLTLAAEARTGITVVKWWPLRSGSLRGFANVHVEKFKLVIHGCPVNEANGRRWASLPGKVQIGKDGEIIRKDTGKPSYLPMGTCADDRIRRAFSDAVVQAVADFDPLAFDEGRAT